MKIFLCASKYNYRYIPQIQDQLLQKGYIVTLPNSYSEPFSEDVFRSKSVEAHREWKAMMLRHQAETIAQNDAILVINYDKDNQKNYIGGATFLEVYEAFRQGKQIFFWHALPQGMLYDELVGMGSIVIDEDICKIHSGDTAEAAHK